MVLIQRMENLMPLNKLCDEMDSFLDAIVSKSPFDLSLPSVCKRAFPAVNVWQDDNRLIIETEVPGFAMSDIEVQLIDNTLTIQGCRSESQSENIDYVRRERAVGGFSRELRLPVEVDTEKVEASLSNGVLTITLPKAPSVMPKKIEIKRS